MSQTYLPPGLPQSLEVGDRLRFVDLHTGRDAEPASGKAWYYVRATKLPWVRLQLGDAKGGGEYRAFWVNLRRITTGWRKAEHGE